MDITATSAIRELNEKVQHESVFTDRLKKEIKKAIIGQEAMIDRLILSLLANGHVLLEGVPGLAKTLAIKTLASAVHCKIQPHSVYSRPFARRFIGNHDF
jgi:MoxR-like ATPase